VGTQNVLTVAPLGDYLMHVDVKPLSRRSSDGAQATAEESSTRKTVLGIGEDEKPNLSVATTQVKVTGGQLVVSNFGIVDYQESERDALAKRAVILGEHVLIYAASVIGKF
jgi:hypothetical protein